MFVEATSPTSRSNGDVSDRLRAIVAAAVPRGGLLSNVYNLASATLGASIVSVASGFHDCGIVVSVLLLVVVCAGTIYSLRLLAIVTDKTGLRSYEQMARALLGHGWDYFTAFIMFMFCWGTCIGYVIAVGDMLTPMLDSPSVSPFLRSAGGRRLLMAVVWLAGMLPLSLPKEVNSLRYASVVGVTFVIFFVGCVIAHAARSLATTGLPPGLHIVTATGGGSISAIRGLTLFLFSFTNQVNAPEIYEEMRDPTPRRMTRDATVSMTLVMALNLLSGLFGYLDYGNDVTGSILLLYRPRQDNLMLFSYAGICCKVCVGFAICVQPSRDAVYYCLGWGRTRDVPQRVNWAVSALVAASALLVGLVLPDLSVVFSLLGGICGGSLGLLLPTYFYLYSGGITLARVGILNCVGCAVLIVGGVVAVVFGTASSLAAQFGST